MIPIHASDGAGLVPHAELYEAIGRFLIQDAPQLTQDMAPGWTTSFVHKGRVYRVSEVLGYIPDCKRPQPVRLHFDYIKQS